jgi:deazaflavin-dependent oxidoreductase (nitroreductase family)
MGLMTPVAVRIGAIPWLPRLLPQIVWCDRMLQRLSRGRLTVLDLAGLPNVVLTVAGRHSGVPRSTPLLCVPYGDRWLIAGSYFGGPDMPVWVHNLRAAGHATITWRRERIPVEAREVEGEERAERWTVMLRTWPNFARYEKRTDRVIPVFELTRR